MSSALTVVAGSAILAKRGADKAQHALDASTTAQREAEAEGAAQIREDFAPYREAGGRALTRLESLISGDYDVSKTAGYDFRLKEGYKGLDRSQAGRRLGGRAAKEAMRYGQDYASGEFMNEFNREKSMVDMGQASAAQQASQTGASTARLSNIEGDYGANRVGIEGAKSAAQQSTISNLSTAWANYNKPPATGSAPAYGSGKVTSQPSVFNQPLNNNIAGYP